MRWLATSALLAVAACAEASTATMTVDAAQPVPDSRSIDRCDDTANDPLNCGACGRTCIIPNATAGCVAGDCVIAACDSGFADSDGDVSNGCEADRGLCRAEVCNALDDDCDGSCDEGALGGCRIGIHRSVGDGHLYSSDLATAQAAPYRLEARNYFHTYAAPAMGLTEAYLCKKANGRHFLTVSGTCEGAGTVLQSVGFWASESRCSAVPLYRLYSPAGGNHFYTTSAPERDNAVNNLGYVFESIAGYVWTAP